MRASTVIAAGLFAVANAQSSASDASVVQLPTPTGGTAEQTAAAEATNKCIKSCDADDMTCIAACISVPAPNEDQVNETTECSAKCDQGDGSPEDTVAFGECLDACRQKYFFNDESGTPKSDSSSGSSDSDDDDSTTTATNGAAASASDAAASIASSATDAAASGVSSASDAAASGASSASESAADATGSADAAEESGESEDDDSAAAGIAASSAFTLFGFVAAFFL